MFTCLYCRRVSKYFIDKKYVSEKKSIVKDKALSLKALEPNHKIRDAALAKLLSSIDPGLKFVHVKGICKDPASRLRQLFRFQIIYGVSLKSFLLTVERTAILVMREKNYVFYSIIKRSARLDFSLTLFNAIIIPTPWLMDICSTFHHSLQTFQEFSMRQLWVLFSCTRSCE